MLPRVEASAGNSEKAYADDGRASRRSHGLTLIELLMGIAVSSILVGAMAVLASSVGDGATFVSEQNNSIQHAQVVLGRIGRLVNEARTTETYPGVVVISETVGGYRYPTTLVIWRPANGVPANASGPPLVKELVIIAPNPANPNELCEFTAANDTRTVQMNDASLNTSTGRALISGVTTATTSLRTQLTPRMRSAATSTASGASLRGCVRFECELHPTDAEIAAFRAGTATWDSLNWVQNVKSSTFGLRQVWLRTELQLLSEPLLADGTVPANVDTLPFFGSGTIYYSIEK